MTQDILLVEKARGVATLTLNRPDKLNALSMTLRKRIVDAFRRLEDDPETAVVILTGAGRAFCAGLDLEEFGRGDAIISGPQDAAVNPAMAMAAFSGPIIGAINGPAVTGGFELALMCDFMVASSSARFADTHGRVGLSPAWGLSQKLPRIIGLARAKELSLTGNFIDAETAERWGLVNRVVAPEALMPTCRDLAADMLSTVPAFRTHYKRLMDTGFGMTFAEAMAYETQTAIVYNEKIPIAEVEARRQTIRERGQRQK